MAGRIRPATENTGRMTEPTLYELAVPHRRAGQTARRASAGPREVGERSDVYSAAPAPTRNPEAAEYVIRLRGDVYAM